MAEKRSTKKRRKGDSESQGTATKEEKKVAQYLRFNLDSKKATLYGNEAFYFQGSKAVEFLLDSKWAKGTKSSVVITHRESAVTFLNRLMSCGMFSHVEVIKTEKKVKDKKKDEKKKEEKSKNEEKSDTKDEKKAPGSPKAKKDKEGKEVKKVKKKVKTTLEYHDHQIFLDGEDEYYVWTYDPLSWTTLFLGILLVLAVILICLFPLWPENIREYSWYLSVAGAVCVGVILVLAVLRYIIYGILWVFTMGKLHFWLLPNLTAECGFFESFVPVYEYEFRGSSEKKTKKSKTKVSTDKNKDKKEKANENKPDSSDIKEKNIEEENVEEKNIQKENPEEKDTEKENSEEKDKEEEVNIAKDQANNDSEGSSGSPKEEGWVKVKKGDLSEVELEQTEEKC